MNTSARLAAVAGAVTLVFAGIAPAQADRYSRDDAARDVTTSSCTYTWPEDPEAEAVETCDEYHVDATRTEGDILRTTVNHGTKNVVVRAQFSELTRSTTQFRAFVAPLVTNEGYKRELVVLFDPDSGSTYGEVQLFLPNGEKASCTGEAKVVDFTANVIEARVPRSCLSMPYWVQAGAALARVSFVETDDSFTIAEFYDDGHINGLLDPYAPIAYGPKVKRAVA